MEAQTDTASAEPFPLLSLPEGLLAAHVWPHLGPWARSQLHAACKQLRVVADGQLGPGLRVALTEEELRAAALQQTNHPGAAGGGSQLEALCRMLRRLPHLTELALVLAFREPHDVEAEATDSDEGGAQGDLSSRQPQDAADLVSAIGRHGQASVGRLRKLAIVMHGGPFGQGWYASPAVLSAVGSHFPHLTHLRLGTWELREGGQGDWAAALAQLPPSLARLHLEVYCDEVQEPMAQAFMQQVQLQALGRPALRGLHLGWSGFACGLGLAVATATAPHLQHLAVHGLCLQEGREDYAQLAAALAASEPSSNLRSLDFGVRVGRPGFRAAPVLVALLGQLPNLQALTIRDHFLSTAAVASPALTSLTHLTSLALGAWLPEVPVPEGYAPRRAALPASLVRLALLREVYCVPWRGLLPRLPPHCCVSIASTVPLGQAAALAALAYPGGVSMVLRTADPLTKNATKLEVAGMICVDSAEVLHAVAAAGHQVHALQLGLVGTGALPGAAGVLQSCAHACLGQLCTLAIGGSPAQGGSVHPGTALQALAQLLEAGQLPKLQRLLLRLYQGAPPYAGLAPLRAPLLRLLQAGCAVHLLPGHYWETARAVTEAAFRELRGAAPDPDMLLLGVREQVHGEGEFAA